MEHPLINNVEDLTTQQLQERVTDLTKKLGIAYRMGNAQLINQIKMALETFQAKLRERQQQEYDRQMGKGKDFGDRIDIS